LSKTTRLHSHEVSHPLNATHPPRFTTPELYLPRSRYVLALTMCLDVLLPRWTPWCPFNQAHSRGAPFRALPGRDRRAFRRNFPSCDWLTDRRNRHKCLLTSFCLRTAARLAAIRRAHRTIQCMTIELSLSGVWCLSAFGAEASLPQRPRFRGLIPLSIRARRRRISPRAAALALLGFILLGAFPFRASTSTALPSPNVWGFAQPRSSTFHPTGTQLVRRVKPVKPVSVWSPLGTSGRSQTRVCSCASECQRAGKLAHLDSRGCRPLEVFVLISALAELRTSCR
jgi:hypothetical protein